MAIKAIEGVSGRICTETNIWQGARMPVVPNASTTVKELEFAFSFLG
jgi:hypothetical protein